MLTYCPSCIGPHLSCPILYIHFADGIALCTWPYGPMAVSVAVRLAPVLEVDHWKLTVATHRVVV